MNPEGVPQEVEAGLDWLLVDLSLVLVGSAVLAWLAARLRQPIIVAYVLCGVLIGPFGLGLVGEVEFITGLARLGVTLLLFLAGIVLHPRHLVALLRKTTVVTLLSCSFSFVLAWAFALRWGWPMGEAAVVGLALMFSSTILVVKLLPTTALHQEPIGAVCISILVAEDILAVAVLVVLGGLGPQETVSWVQVSLKVAALALRTGVLVLGTALLERYLLRPWMKSIDRFHEEIFVTGLAWCSVVALTAHWLGLSFEVGAFIAGVTLARQPVSLFISEKLKPLRDFFLVLFFFAIGAALDPRTLGPVVVPGLILAGALLVLRPLVFWVLLRLVGEPRVRSPEAALRLGQASEFALLIAFFGQRWGVLSSRAGQLIQFTTIITLVASSYLVTYLLPTPIGTSTRLQRD